MGAPLGNKSAVGHGRPPKYSNEQVIQIGKDLLKWCDDQDKDPKSKIVHLSEFYVKEKDICRSDWWHICERDCFRAYYEKASDWMGKRIIKSDYIPVAYGSRFLSMYFADLRMHEKDTLHEKIDAEVEAKARLAEKQDVPSRDELLQAQEEIIKLKGQIAAFSQTAPIVQPGDSQV